MPNPLKSITPETELYPIRTVVTLTGVNPVTLRAWERRYGLIKPIRTPKGHRLYTAEDIDRIHKILAQLDRGLAVSQIRHTFEKPGSATERAVTEVTDLWTDYRETMISAIARFNEERLENVYNEVLSLYPASLVTRRLLLPLLEQLGRRWETAQGSVAEEHFFGVYLRNKLGARFHHRTRGNTGPRLMVACLPGEQHEVGLLLFALGAHDLGYRLVLLGANTPLAELALAIKRAQVDALVLSGSIDPEPSVLANELPPLVAAAGVPVFIGGHTSVVHRDALVRAGTQPLGGDIEQGLKRLADLLPVNR